MKDSNITYDIPNSINANIDSIDTKSNVATFLVEAGIDEKIVSELEAKVNNNFYAQVEGCIGRGVKKVFIEDSYLCFLMSDGDIYRFDAPIGKDGKSAYQSAIDGGYTGAEDKFNVDLATVSKKLDKEEGKTLVDTDDAEFLDSFSKIKLQTALFDKWEEI